MPESKGRAKPKAHASQPQGSTAASSRTTKSAQKPVQKIDSPNPVWFVPVMLGLMILGVLWIVTLYITNGEYPIASLHYWNVAIGMGLILSGFVMSMWWR